MAWTVPADLERAAGAAGATTSSSPHGHDARHAAAVVQQNHVAHVLHDLLAAFFQAYLVDQADVRKERMSTLLMQADGMGLLGVRSVPALSALFVALEADLGADARRFAAFYHFVFFIARERGHRNLAFGTAVDGWRFLLGNGRFALLEAWCDFVSRRTGDKGVSEDTWCQVRPPPPRAPGRCPASADNNSFHATTRRSFGLVPCPRARSPLLFLVD